MLADHVYTIGNWQLEDVELAHLTRYVLSFIVWRCFEVI